MDSDGEGLHSNLPLCSSSEDDEGEDGEELESQTSQPHEAPKEIQMAVLGDLRFLFSKDQEDQRNTDQDTMEENNGALGEDGADANRGKQLPEYEPDWEDIVKMVENMGLAIVPNENLTTEEGKKKISLEN